MNCLYAFALTMTLMAWAMSTLAADDATTKPDKNCPITSCMVKSSKAYAKAIGFEVPKPKMMDNATFMGDRTDVYTVMCTLYAHRLQCLKGCDAAKDASSISARKVQPFLPTYSDLCTDNQPEFHQWTPCLVANTSVIQKSCGQENDNALAAAIRLSESSAMDDTELESYCDSVNHQVSCELALVRGHCGEESADLFRQLIHASFLPLRVSVGDETFEKIFKKCVELLRSTEQLDNSTIVMPSTPAGGVTMEHTTTRVSVNTTTMTTMATTSVNNGNTSVATGNVSTTQAIRKDAADPYKGDSAYQTTTPSAATNIRVGCFTLVSLVTSFFVVAHSTVLSSL